MKGPNNINEFLWAADLPQNLPKSLPVHRVEGLSTVYKNYVKILMLLATLFLNLSRREGHVSNSTTSPKTALALRQNFMEIDVS